MVASDPAKLRGRHGRSFLQFIQRAQTHKPARRASRPALRTGPVPTQSKCAFLLEENAVAECEVAVERVAPATVLQRSVQRTALQTHRHTPACNGWRRTAGHRHSKQSRRCSKAARAASRCARCIASAPKPQRATHRKQNNDHNRRQGSGTPPQTRNTRRAIKEQGPTPMQRTTATRHSCAFAVRATRPRRAKYIVATQAPSLQGSVHVAYFVYSVFVCGLVCGLSDAR
jgi:hypothetical protein